MLVQIICLVYKINKKRKSEFPLFLFFVMIAVYCRFPQAGALGKASLRSRELRFKSVISLKKKERKNPSFLFLELIAGFEPATC